MDYEDDILVADVETEIEEQQEIKTEQETSSTPDFKKEFSSYSNEKIKRQTNKYDFSKSFNPNTQKDADFEKFVKQTDEEVDEDLTLEQNIEESIVKTNNSANIFKICASLICTLMLILCIINISSLTNLQNNVNNLESNVNSTQTTVNNLIEDASNLTGDSEILSSAQQNGMQDITNEIQVVLNPKNEVKQFEVKSNWFDEFCNFLSNLF